MKAVFTILVAVIVVVQSDHLFLGTNVNRTLVYHQNLDKSNLLFWKTVESNVKYILPSVFQQRVIQGILAVDTKDTEASANVAEGGIGYNFVKLRIKSESGRGLHYEVYIYA